MEKISLVVEKLASSTHPNRTKVKEIQTSRIKYPGARRSSLFQLTGSRYFFVFLFYSVSARTSVLSSAGVE